MNLAELEAVENKKGFNKTQSSYSFHLGAKIDPWQYWHLCVIGQMEQKGVHMRLGDLILIMKRKGLPLSPGGWGRTERQLSLGGNDTESWSAVQMAVKFQVCWTWKELTVAFSFILPWARNVWPPVMQRLRDLCRNRKQEGRKDRFSSCLDLGETGLHQKHPPSAQEGSQGCSAPPWVLTPHTSRTVTALEVFWIYGIIFVFQQKPFVHFSSGV